MQTEPIVEPEGLTAAEAAARLARFGPNQPVPQRQIARLGPLLHALTDPMVLLLFAAGLIYLALGEAVDGTILVAAVVPIVAMDLALEMRAERTLARLRELTVPRAKVVRDGRLREMPSADLVPGDLVAIQEGDVVPADGVLIAAADLQVDESALTGESQPVDKTVAPLAVLAELAGEPGGCFAAAQHDGGGATRHDGGGAAQRDSQAAQHDNRVAQQDRRASETVAGGATGATGGTSAAAREHRVAMATTVLAGRGRMIVTATGPRTEYGRIGSLVALGDRPTPLEAAIGRLVKRLGVVAAGVWLVVIAVQRLQGSDWADAVLAGISLAIATIPEEFPIVFALYLSLGVWRLAQRNALIRRLAGVEVLGGTSVICTDKTGTLTLGRLDLGAVAVGGHVSAAPAAGRAGELLLGAAVLASEPEPFDPLETAIVRGAAVGLDVAALRRQRSLVHEYGFDPGEKLMAHVWREPNGRLRLYAKGALEGILHHAIPTQDERERLLAANARLAGQAMRVLAVAVGDLDRPTGDRQKDLAGLRAVGLLGFADRIRPEVPAAVAECQQAGIRIIMLTGDHPLTAHAIAEAAGLHHDDAAIVHGETLERADPQELGRLVRRAAIFARILPADKFRIVRALQANGDVVAMTGDGINDAPALRAADIGVAMGRRGTAVAREAATMVLLDDNFATIVAAVREGRRIFQNLQRAFAYLIGFHLPIVLAAFLIPLLRAPLLLLPVHLVLLELLLHPTVSLVFVSEPPAPDLMRQPPRPRRAPLIDRQAVFRTLTAGLAISAVTIVLYLGALAGGVPLGRARALALAALILGQTLLVLVERAPDRPFWSDLGANRWLLPIVGGTLAILAAVLFVPPLQTIFKLQSLQPADALTLLGAVIAISVMAEIARFLSVRRNGLWFVVCGFWLRGRDRTP
ncbi:MAG: cation-transporting P-type ATPase [Chloroflexi bacterium]|nr:cation-transporting P-type ATPase [Chloroflexota bacterium]